MFFVDYNTKKSMRESFGKKLEELGADKNIVVMDADLSCSTQTRIFAKSYPSRFFNSGIAEQNMIATAAGLALAGKTVFVASFAMFVTGRTYDQIRTSVCYQNANVKIIGTHGGVTVGEDGATHQALEDVSLMRGLPNMTVIVPSDCNECAQAVEYAKQSKTPVYIRISRSSVPDIYSNDYKFDVNKAVVLKEGNDVTLIANGDIMSEVCKAVEVLANMGIDVELISLPVVKPLDSATILNSVRKTKKVVTIEDHSVIGGIGSVISELLSEQMPTKLLRIGTQDCFGQSGSIKNLLACYGLDAESIVKKVREFI